MQLFAKVTAVGDLREVPTRNENTQYDQPLRVRTIEVKWFTPRGGQTTYAGVTTAGLELRKNLATDCRLVAGDWICADCDLYGNHYEDNDHRHIYSSRLVVNRYALISDFGELK